MTADEIMEKGRLDGRVVLIDGSLADLGLDGWNHMMWKANAYFVRPEIRIEYLKAKRRHNSCGFTFNDRSIL